MRIVHLYSENVKRLQAVSITPTGNVVEISGANGNGKTSVLDSIFWALAGTTAHQADPIRHGADSALIQLDLGTYKVTRKFHRQDGGKHTTSLVIESPEGAVFKSPQTNILDKLLSGLSFDPLAFSRMKPREQFDLLRQFVPDVDFDAIDRANKDDRDKRTDANRRHKEAHAAAGAVVIPAELPPEPEDEVALMDAITNAASFNADITREKERRAEALGDAAKDRMFAAEKQREAKQLRERADALDREAQEQFDAAAKDEAAIQAAPPLAEPADVSALRIRHAAAQEARRIHEQAAEATRRRTALEKVASDAAKISDELTAAINKRDADKAAAVAAVQMPVDGLGFGDDCITLNGVPFEQGSDAEQLRASIAIAMRLNPKLRVIRVRDGSLLDDNSMRLLAEMAEQHDVQVWIETVRPSSAAAIVIEDGHVAGTQEPEALQAGAA